jgi:glycosyltransferase involved in cell wall biosynthesis
MIKILIITPLLQHYRLSFYEKLSTCNSNYDLRVFYGLNNKEDGKAGYSGVTRFISKGFKEYKYRILPFDLVYNKGMYSEIKRTNPDVIIMLASTGNLTYRRIISWAKKNNKKIIIWTSGWDPGRAKGLLLSFKNRLVSSFFKKADYFLTYSTNATRYVESMGIDNAIIEPCYNGIELDDLIKGGPEIIKTSAEIIRKHDLENYMTFLYVGGIIPEKRVDLLVDAFIELRKKYNNIKLLIIGDGPLRGMLEEKMKNYNDSNIIYLGRIINGVDSFFVASDCLVLPGAGGLALNQAMFWGKTCIVSKADGTEDDLVIENISGYRFEENNLGSLIAAMERRIIDDQDKVKILSDNAMQIIMTKSNVNNMVKVFSGAIDKLIALSD